MILLAAVLVLVAVGLLAVGLIEGSATLQWASFTASALAALVVVGGEVLRHVATRRAEAGAVPEVRPPAPPAGLPALVPPPASPADDLEAPMPPAAVVPADPGQPAVDDEPPVEEVEVSDLLVVLDLSDEVLVVDEHPRYHLAGCSHLTGATAVPLPMVEARTDGFTPCGTCAPDRNLARVERARRAT